MKPGGRIQAIHVMLDVKDLQTSVAFYRDVLGFSECFPGPDCSMVERDCVELWLSEPEAFHPNQKPAEPKRSIVSLTVSDLAGMLEHVRRNGGRSPAGPMRITKNFPSFKVADPSGNVFIFQATEKIERPPGEPWIETMNREELVTPKYLAPAIGCTRRFVVAMLRAGYRLQYPSLRRTTPRHALAALESVSNFSPEPYLKDGRSCRRCSPRAEGDIFRRTARPQRSAGPSR
jgi:predicted enzyme related to lactoylglutathione lyase